MARSGTSSSKQKTFPPLDAPIPKSTVIELDNQSDNDTSSDESDAPEAETLSGGRAAAAARVVAIEQYQQKLKEKRKIKNKAREEFIQSTKSKASPTIPTNQRVGEDAAEEDGDEIENEDDGEEGPSDSVLEARMTRAMQDAEEADEESSNEDLENPVTQLPTLSPRLPDSIFVAAAAAHQSVERKRMKKSLNKEVQVKRRRIREASVEQVINGPTFRVITPLDAPPPISSPSSRKVNKTIKGGSAFRRKWKKVDAMRAQIRSRSGPARKFVTAVQ